MKPLCELPLFGNSTISDAPPMQSGPYAGGLGFKGPPDGASADAAKEFAPAMSELRKLVLKEYRNSPDGLTADEAAKRLQRTPFAIRPRVAELKRQGLLKSSEQRRRNESGASATVWMVAS